MNVYNEVIENNEERTTSVLYALVPAFPKVSFYFLRQTQQSTPVQEVPDHPSDTLLQLHHQGQHIAQNQSHEAPL